MIEILNKSDIQKVKDEKIKEYLEYSFKRLPLDFEYPKLGYFVVIEELNELTTDIIKLTNHSFSRLKNCSDDINMVEIKDGIMEILVFIDNDVSISLVLSLNILDTWHKEYLVTYQI